MLTGGMWLLLGDTEQEAYDAVAETFLRSFPSLYFPTHFQLRFRHDDDVLHEGLGSELD